MENKETMNLQQKLIAISNEMPKLLKKHYSDEVDYDFVKIDDIFELLNPAFTKHHICLQELEETDAAYSKVDASWIYTAKLTFFIVNADCPEEKERVSIQLVGDHLDSPAKAKGAAWTYGFKYFFLYKFRMKQETEDPDMKGTPNGPDRGNTQGKKSELPAKVQKPDSKGADIIADSPLSKTPVQESKKAKSDVLTDDDLPDPADFLKEEQTEERDGEVKVSEEKLSEEPSFQESEAANQPVAKETEAFKENPSDFSEEENSPEHSFPEDFETEKMERELVKEETTSKRSEKEIQKKEETQVALKDKKEEVEEHLGQMNLLDFSNQQTEPSMKSETKSSERVADEGTQAVDKEEDRKEEPVSSDLQEQFEEVKEEEPFEEADEDDFFLQLQRDMESEAEKKPLTVEEAKKVICPYALFEGKPFGEMLQTETGYRQLQWFANEYRGSDFRIKEAAQLLVENCEQKAA